MRHWVHSISLRNTIPQLPLDHPCQIVIPYLLENHDTESWVSDAQRVLITTRSHGHLTHRDGARHTQPPSCASPVHVWFDPYALKLISMRYSAQLPLLHQSYSQFSLCVLLFCCCYFCVCVCVCVHARTHTHTCQRETCQHVL